MTYNVFGGTLNLALSIYLITSVHSALETFATIVLYKSTYTIPYHTIPYR